MNKVNLNNNEKDSFTEAKKIFHNFKKLFFEYKSMNLQFLESIIFQNDQEWKKEISIMKKIFKISDKKKQKECIFNQNIGMILFQNRKNMICLLNKIINFLNKMYIQNSSSNHLLRDNLEIIVRDFKTNDDDQSLMNWCKNRTNLNNNDSSFSSSSSSSSSSQNRNFYPELLYYILIHNINLNETNKLINSWIKTRNINRKLNSLLEFLQSFNKEMDKGNTIETFNNLTNNNIHETFCDLFCDLSSSFHDYFKKNVFNIYEKSKISIKYSKQCHEYVVKFRHEKKIKNIFKKKDELPQIKNLLEAIEGYCVDDYHYSSVCKGLKDILSNIYEILCLCNRAINYGFKKRTYIININEGC
eukprot:jgi/Orpsp1_1/1186603/evm.model.d7180000051836.1